MSKIKRDKLCNSCGRNVIRHKYKGGSSGKKKHTWSGSYQVCTTCDKMVGAEKRYTKK